MLPVKKKNPVIKKAFLEGIIYDVACCKLKTKVYPGYTKLIITDHGARTRSFSLPVVADTDIIKAQLYLLFN